MLLYHQGAGQLQPHGEELYHRMLFQTHLSDSSLLMRVSSSAEWLMIFTATRRLFHTPLVQPRKHKQASGQG
jgi:hypothetical protein